MVKPAYIAIAYFLLFFSVLLASQVYAALPLVLNNVENMPTNAYINSSTTMWSTVNADFAPSIFWAVVILIGIVLILANASMRFGMV